MFLHDRLLIVMDFTLLILAFGWSNVSLSLPSWPSWWPPQPPLPLSFRHRRRTRLRTLASAVSLLYALPAFVLGTDAFALAGLDGVATSHYTPTQAATMRSVLQAASSTTVLSSVQGFHAVVDTGCSKFATPTIDDFDPGSFRPSTSNHIMHGIAGGLTIAGTGTVRYEVLDHYGRVQSLRGPGLLIKDLPVRLIPPQVAMATDSVGHFQINGEGGKFYFAHDGGVVNTPLDLHSNLPMVIAFHDATQSAATLHKSLYACVTNETNQNLGPTQKETLRWHFRLGHASLASIRWLGQRNLLGSLSSRITKVTDTPLCGTCQYGRQTRRPTGVTHHTIPPDKVGGIIGDKLTPGAEIAVDQYETRTRGRRFDTAGRERPEDKFAGGTIFCDVASGYTRCYPQVSLGGSETIRSKIQFEREALAHGVVIRGYRTDNGIFTKEAFMSELDSKNQLITSCGVGAHHQNGVAERSIRTLVERSRTVLLHAQLRWMDETSVELWPMAMQHTSYLINVIPNIHEGLSPEEKFSQSFHGTNRLSNLPVWGCPAYVLQPQLQDKKKLPKWEPRSRRGQYLGWSPLHASNVALVRNLKTGYISPQFHLIFDNWFETVVTDDSEDPPAIWEVLVTNSYFRSNLDPDDLNNLDLGDEWLSADELLARRQAADRARSPHGGGGYFSSSFSYSIYVSVCLWAFVSRICAGSFFGSEGVSFGAEGVFIVPGRRCFSR